MSITINTSDVIALTIAKVHTVEVLPGNFNQDVLAYIFAYGLKQVLNDAGSAMKTPEAKLEAAEQKLEALYRGELRKSREPGATADPVAKEANRLAGELVKATLGRMWKNEFKAVDMARVKAFAAKHELDLSDMGGFLEAAEDIVASSERIMAQAAKNVADARALNDLI